MRSDFSVLSAAFVEQPPTRFPQPREALLHSRSILGWAASTMAAAPGNPVATLEASSIISYA